MIEKKFNDSWLFWRDTDSFALIWNIPEKARKIDLPHDAMIENAAYKDSPNKGNTGYRDSEVYHYVKIMNVPEEYRNKTVILKFEGIYMNAFIYVNGQLAAKSPFGYSNIYVHLDPYLKYGADNEIRVIVRNGAMPNSRWYSGGGIYRDVYLLISDLMYIVEEGVQINTETLEKDFSVINVTTEVKNRKHVTQELKLETRILDIDGTLVAKDMVPFVLFEQECRKVFQRIVIENPKAWSAEEPNLYQCISLLHYKNDVIDKSITFFGIRTLSLDAKNGLRVNGKSVKLRGACIHHDSGLLGAATYEDAQYRQISILKNAGFNAVRMAHNPMAPSMLRACDEIGMYVMDETFDMWNRCKSDYDYGLYFQEWWEKDVTAMVRKDYNHPSVILYSIGNEIPEIATSHGTWISYKINDKIKSLDSTRYTLAAVNGVFAAGDVIEKITADVLKKWNIEVETEGNVNDFMTYMDKYMDDIVVHPQITKRLELACANTDIAGYNYMTARYEIDGKNYPHRVIVGSETYPPQIARNWDIIEKNSHVIGDFTWTGWDYIGEAGVGIPAYSWGEGGFGAGFPCQLAYVGDIDITGYRRPASYFREIVFGFRKDPYITVQNPYESKEKLIKTPWVISDSLSSWSYDNCDGRPVTVEIYSPGDEVELFLNGKSLGRKPTGKTTGFITYFDVIYEPGRLRAVSYEKGNVIGQMDLLTAGKARKLQIIKEDRRSSELIYLQIEVRDEKGVLVTHENYKLEIQVEGAAELIGLGTGNPRPKYNYTESVTETFYGRALAILKKKDTGEAKISVKSESGLKNEITLHIG